MITRVTVECTECGTVRNKVRAAHPHVVLGEDILTEMNRTETCPYCDHTGVRPVEEVA
ncbi:hypothetical protein H1S01_08735 [Heliobacterium chlorum]|uniref:CpXC domain-containing protein n=1 Tax=Heliobacterium chlorum TaxID=2698 RepID=A0ABR7T1C5_HELCL|nr:hypothetical protein [Heliobacterium chlorum]MBC9784595.1 hypothetical protein [Heliobacterium chlorum]